ncbi:GNAT family N-acetyltransferase [Hymenobacter sp. BRD128]|uniref:GNAT family N-acetyltransferase n=1 Tax=Hymenobacter sp. BRD128 TaxID=2675878 RepID=UPI0015642947|nr:GNAT family N-acetyltransferase [Hymenobacter sp. BRD128]QKG56328.1 GNAT family N-acetyltransferase [Hymenobacter sp. BRD128]
MQDDILPAKSQAADTPSHTPPVYTPGATIRPVGPADLPALLALLQAVGLFDPEGLREMHALLTRYVAGAAGPDDHWLVAESATELAGAVYYAPERMAQGTWNLYFIGVHPDHRRQGQAMALLQVVEAALAARNGRLLLIETSGDEDQEPARALYRHAGYEQEARIREFYAVGTDKVVFRKALPVVAAQP